MAPASAVAPVFNPAKLIPILLWRDAHQVAAPSCLKGEPDESRKSLKLMVNTAKSSAVASGAPRYGKNFPRCQRLGCVRSGRAFHGRLNNPGHQWVEFRDETSDVPGEAFDGVVANVQPVASP